MLYQKCANLSIIVIFNTFSDFQITVTKSCIYCLFIVATSSNNRPPSDLSDACMLYNYLKNEIISQEFNVDQKEPNCQAKSPYKTKKSRFVSFFGFNEFKDKGFNTKTHSSNGNSKHNSQIGITTIILLQKVQKIYCTTKKQSESNILKIDKDKYL